jgi:hypothetical protein
MRASFLSVLLAITAAGCGLCAASYAAMTRDTSPRQAMAYALPFMLFSTASGSAALLGIVAAIDKASPSRRIF